MAHSGVSPPACATRASNVMMNMNARLLKKRNRIEKGAGGNRPSLPGPAIVLDCAGAMTEMMDAPQRVERACAIVLARCCVCVGGTPCIRIFHAW